MSGPIAVLTGGVGGAKLVLGLCEAFPDAAVTSIVNTGDDFDHLGMRISPDLDTLLYTLAGKANRTLGWGREDESWSFMAALASLGGEAWFRLGDGDLALHVLRTQRLAGGGTLSDVMAEFAAAWNVAARLLPMTNDVVATEVVTDREGVLSFQRYFVARQCEPAVRAIRFAGAATARPAPGVIEAILDPGMRAIVIAPSNPWLSVDPILAVPGIREALAAAPAPVVAVSPLVDGKAVKGPTGKLMAELGLAADAVTIAGHYAGVIDAILIDERDPPCDPGIASARADTLMHSLADKVRVARAVLALADGLSR